MSTWRSEFALTHLATGMWEEPGVWHRLRLLPAVTVVSGGSLVRTVLIPALGTDADRER